MTDRDYIVRADGEWVRDKLGRLVSFTASGAHRWAARRKPGAYSVAFLHRPGRTPEPGFATHPEEPAPLERDIAAEIHALRVCRHEDCPYDAIEGTDECENHEEWMT